MAVEVIAIFDIGKTNKKFLLFDAGMKIVFQSEQVFDEIADDDDFPCDDIKKIECWIRETISAVIKGNLFQIKAINFSCYGASLVYLDEKGDRVGLLYNYLKPMSDDTLEGFYEKYGGVGEFSCNAASPALGMLNSGLQILWLKQYKPELFGKIKSIIHFPQYLSYLFTREIVSEYTSIGCHTAMWDFERNQYHRWLADEGIHLPEPLSNSTVFNVEIEGKRIDVGIGIHDSSASLVPYFMRTNEKFILISTGTWCIFMNPFNKEPLTTEQLQHDTLCYISINQQQVKSSRLFFGHIHDVNVARLSAFFNVDTDYYKNIGLNECMLKVMLERDQHQLFFKEGIPDGFIDYSIDLSTFESFEEAYHKLMYDLIGLCVESIKLITSDEEQTEIVYISGGFSRNTIFVKFLKEMLPNKRVIVSEIDNSSALGAMMVVWEKAFGQKIPKLDKEVGQV
jgi:sugar (pentulose or hexulose) kinase